MMISFWLYPVPLRPRTRRHKRRSRRKQGLWFLLGTPPRRPLTGGRVSTALDERWRDKIRSSRPAVRQSPALWHMRTYAGSTKGNQRSSRRKRAFLAREESIRTLRTQLTAAAATRPQSDQAYRSLPNYSVLQQSPARSGYLPTASCHPSFLTRIRPNSGCLCCCEDRIPIGRQSRQSECSSRPTA